MASTPKLTLTTVQPLISPACGMSTIPCIHQIWCYIHSKPSISLYTSAHRGSLAGWKTCLTLSCWHHWSQHFLLCYKSSYTTCLLMRILDRKFRWICIYHLLRITPFSWSAKKQTGVAHSFTKAEYRSIDNASPELRWICYILTELGITLQAPLVVYCDKLEVTFLCPNHVFHTFMKHVALDYHFIRGQIQNGVLRVAHIITKDHLGDALRKPLNQAPFHDLRNMIGVFPTQYFEGTC